MANFGRAPCSQEVSLVVVLPDLDLSQWLVLCITLLLSLERFACSNFEANIVCSISYIDATFNFSSELFIIDVYISMQSFMIV